MKRFLIPALSLLSLVLANIPPAYAVKAYPFPVRVVQPDGSFLTIRIHGDEFLNWKTSGGRLVMQGKDLFYYYAEFSADGRKLLTPNRVIESQASPLLQDLNPYRPPAIALERAFELRRTSSPVPVSIPARSISIGGKPFLVILVQFADLTFASASASEDFFNMLNLPGYSANRGTGSAYDYFYENSSGQFNPQFDVIGPVTLPQNYAYYGENDRQDYDLRPREMVSEAVELADQTLGIDFSQYDNNNDGYIDNIFVYYAGWNEAEGGGDDTVWPHQWSIYNWVTVDGVKTGTYACTSEFRGTPSEQDYAGIGTFCHEFGHVLGLPDFYDTDYRDNGQAEELGPYSLMSNGNYNNMGRTPPYFSVMERALVGWITSVEVSALKQTGYYELDPLFQNTGFRSPTPSYTQNYFPNGEYYLYENRRKTGWDTYLPHEGLLIYHVDRSPEYLSRWDNNEVNNYSDHECFDLIEANDPYYSPFPGSLPVTEFTSLTQPAAVDWDGDATGYDLRNISTLVQRITFTTGNSEPLTYYGIYLAKGNYVEGDRFLLQLSGNGRERVSEQWFFNGIPQPSGSTLILPAGEHTIKVIVFYGNGSSETIFQQLHVE
ncbi:MAG: M6 family metalloprotease domain-containing protein [Candidatus Methanomethylophilaceae archaeon]|jgi:M6 family metalloprotease-like protein|nr:M6 family metalloprotease domain-containing protein [Candidatus Methanomethylophilaceae archaeon]